MTRYAPISILQRWLFLEASSGESYGQICPNEDHRQSNVRPESKGRVAARQTVHPPGFLNLHERSLVC